MKLSSFLAQREVLLQQARLANISFAYKRLGDFAERITRARIQGALRLRQASSAGDSCWASLTTLHASQSIIEEHFTDEDLMDFADIAAFAIGEENVDLTFDVDDLDHRFLVPLRCQLEDAGVAIDQR